MRGAVLRLKRGRERARTHPWIFKGDVADVRPAEPGDPVTVVDAAGRFVGRGFYNPRPALCCRIATRVDEALDADFFERRIRAAVAYRTADGEPATLARLIWSEADGLPGIVVDRYDSVLVLQCLTLGAARARREITTALKTVVGDLAVFAADDEAPARLEGFEPVRGWIGEPGPTRIVVEEGSEQRRVRLSVSFGLGQKTGLYLDQRENRARVAPFAAGRDVLDAFSYTAGFACHALVGGARRVVCIESSAEALAAARENLTLNGAAARADVVDGNAFDELRRLDRTGRRFGLIVLDPPPFARSRQSIEAARRGYKEINLRAMRLLEPGGILATFSCSHHMSAALFGDVCRAAAGDARVTLRLRESLTQSADHPVLVNVPETRYLKGLLLERVE